MQWAAAATTCRRGQCNAGGERKRGRDGAPVVRTRLALPAHPAAAPAAAAIPLHRHQPAVSRLILCASIAHVLWACMSDYATEQSDTG
jgi:hypothetical protein